MSKSWFTGKPYPCSEVGESRTKRRKNHQQVADDYFIYLIGRIWANSSMLPPQRCMALVEGLRRRLTEVVAIKPGLDAGRTHKGLARRPRLGPCPQAGHPMCRINKCFAINAAQHDNGSQAAV